MALIERLMHMDTEPESSWISVHQFFAGQMEVMMGYLTTSQVKSYYNMDAEDVADYDALVALCPAASKPGERALYIERVHSVFLLAETRVPGYETPANVRTKLGI